MSLFDTLFPKQTRSDSRRPSARTRATSRRHRGEAFGEQLEQRLALAVTFAPRFTIDAPGDITFAANTMMTAVVNQPGTATQVTNAQNGTGPDSDVWNDDFWNMQYTKVDTTTPGIFASSSADLSLPAGANVLFAGLYYGSRTNTDVQDVDLKTVKFKGPGDAGYTTLTGAAGPNQVSLLGKVIGGVSNLPDNVQTYGAFSNVTNLVQARGAGTYTIANIQGDPGIINHFAGWSLVVAFEAPGANLRNLSVFDGFADVSRTNPNVEVDFTGFTAPPSGPVKANLGFVSYEGDLGIFNDTASFFGGISTTLLSNATNPETNFFNSSISINGVSVTSKNPNYVNQLGFDADILNIDGKIANGATSAKLTLTSTQDQYYPAVVTSAIDLYAPKVTVDKSVVDVNGGIIEPGDTLRYTITVANDPNAFDTAANVILNDAIPAFTTYKPNSLFITAGANSSPTAKTDAIDADQAEALPTGATPPTTAVQFQLGGGAGGGAPAVGGELSKGESTTVTFEVTVNAGFPSEGFITNTAIVNYTSKFTGKPFSTSDTASIQCPPVIDLAITKTSAGGTYVPGELVTYSFTVTNNGPAASPGSIVTDTLPAQTTFSPALNPGWTIVDTTLTYATPPLASGGLTSFELKLLPASDRIGNLVNTATVAVPPRYFDRNLANNTATETDTAAPQVDLAVTKTNGTDTYIPGTSTTYTITINNSGPSFLDNGTISDLLPVPVAVTGTWSVFSSSGVGTLVTPSSGLGSITANLDLAAGGEVVIKYTVDTDSTATDPLVNTVVVTPPQGQGSSTSSTDRDTAAPQVDLAVTKTRTSPLPVIAGELVTYSIVVTSNGPSSITTFSGTDVSIPGLLSPSYSVDTGTYDPNTGIWTADAGDTFDEGEKVTFTFSGTVPANATGTLTNTVSGTPPIFDPNPNNNTSTATDTIVVKPVLTVTKSSGGSTYIPGNPVTYTIVVSNSGPSDLVGGSVVDLLPSVATSGIWTTATAGGATVLPETGGDNINATVNIPKDGSVTFTYTVQTKPIVTPVDPVTGPYPDLFNLVTVSPPPGTAGNTATATDNDTAAPQVDLAVTKTRTSPLPVIAGQLVTYSIVVTSNGPSSITTFSGTDVSIPGLLSPSYSVSTGTYDPNTGIWTANPGDTFDNGETVTFTFSGTVPAGATGTLTNTVSGTPPIFDPNPNNNTSTATDTIVASPVLTITKTASPLIVRAGEGGYTFRLTVANTGPSNAVGVNVVDTLPTGFTATAFSPSAGVLPVAPTAGQFTWTIGTLAAGATTILDITYEVAASVTSGTKTNNAVVAIGEEAKASAKVDVEVEEVVPPLSITPGLVVGSDDGCNGPPWVRVLDPNSGVELSRFLAYDSRFRGSVRVAVGDVTGDGVAEIITAPSRNLVGEVRVFQRNLVGAALQNGVSEWTELTQYRTLAFGPRYRGGVEVAVADIDGDRVNDIVTAMSIQSGMVNVFKVTPGAGDPVANSPFKSFRGAPAGTNNGVTISAGDYINGGILGGPAEIAVGTNSGTRALVRIFDVSGTPKVVRSFNPFANNFRGGVTLSTADYDGNGSLDLIVGAGLNGGSRVEVWNPATPSRLAQTSVFSSLAKPNARVFAVFGTAADGFLGPDSTLYGVQGLNGGRGSKGVWKVLGGQARSLVNSQTSLPPLRIAPIGLPLAPITPRLG